MERIEREEIEKIIKEVERARDVEEKPIGLTITVFAVLLAIATVLSHRKHTDEVLVQSKIVDEWSYYTAKHQRAHDYGREAEFAFLLSERGDLRSLAVKDYRKSIEEQCGDPAGDCSGPVENADLQKEMSSAPPAMNSENTELPENPAVSVVLKSEAKEPGKVSKKKKGAVDLLSEVHQHEQELAHASNLALSFDFAVVLLEISIMLCSVSLLAASRLYWKSSFVTALLAVAMMVGGRWLGPWLAPYF